MAKTLKSATAILTALLVMIFIGSLTAYAANHYNGPVTTSTTWSTLATSTTGFNCNVAVNNASTAFDGVGILRADIRMLGSTGNVLWSESKSCPGYGTRVYWCGPDVYTLQIKVATGSGVARAWETDQDPN